MKIQVDENFNYILRKKITADIAEAFADLYGELIQLKRPYTQEPREYEERIIKEAACRMKTEINKFIDIQLQGYLTGLKS